jgi:glycosyltransferase involved in cell wall biosynthesis
MESHEDIEWYYSVSREIAEELSLFGIDISNHKGIIVTPSPARSRRSREILAQYVDYLSPDAVFTFFGPAYVRFPQVHLMGVATGWLTHSSKLAIMHSGISAVTEIFLLGVIKRHWFRKADRWVVEASCARKGMRRRFFIEEDRIAIVPNNCADIYLDNCTRAPRIEGVLRLLTLSAYYKHKNLEIIPNVAFELQKKDPNLKFEFILTIREGKELNGIMRIAEKLGVEKNIRNIGPVSIVDGPDLYASADIVFMPSLLETFSAVYPEAMVSGCPLITTDLDFAHDICADAALYYSPLNPASAADKIFEVINDASLFDDLVAKGRERFNSFPRQEEKYQMYIKELKAALSEKTIQPALEGQ